MAIEAASRGFRDVHACEIDQTRFGFLLEQVKSQGYPVPLPPEGLSARRAWCRGRQLCSWICRIASGSVLLGGRECLPYSNRGEPKRGRCDGLSAGAAGISGL